MNEEVNFAIGFVTGRPNVCNLINAYYKHMINQIIQYDKKVNLTIFILYDLSYQHTTRTDFYSIIPKVTRENIKIEYITPEDIEEEKSKLIKQGSLSKSEVELFLGHGHAKGRNTIMYYALKQNIDYLLFWDDDEYPIANIKKDNGIEWVNQNNILIHLQNIQQADITIGHHCGYISPIPYMDYHNEIEEKDLKNYIEAISNDIISWESIKAKFENDNGVTYAEYEKMQKQPYEIQNENGGKWVAGSTLCVNLKNIDKIPAFYNPPNARGEDTFFSTRLIDSKVLRVPVYHFHDGFLKYKGIMKRNYPKTLRKIQSKEENIEYRFLKASKGWIKYKPLFMYITKKEMYEQKSKEILEKLKLSIPSINKLFNNTEFNCIIDEFSVYHDNVKECYDKYIETNEIWNKIKQFELYK